MTIAELFVKLGLKGGEATTKGLGAINKGLKEIGSTSLATKAAIAAALVGLERLTGMASQRGMDLYKFSVTTGLSTMELQKWQHALGLADVSAQETADSISAIQAAMTNMQLGKGAPEGFATMMDMVSLDPKRINDTYYVLSKIQEFLKHAPTTFGTELGKSLGLSTNMIQGLKVMNLEKDKGNAKDYITIQQQLKLVQINRGWKEFWFQMQTMGTKFVASDTFGDAFEEIQMGAKGLMGAIKWVYELTEQFKMLKIVIEAIGVAVALYFAPITTIIGGALVAIAEFQKTRDKKDSWLFGSVSDNKKYNTGGTFGLAKGGAINEDAIAPPVKTPTSAGGTQQNINVTNHITGTNLGKDELLDTLNKHVDRTARKMSAQTGGH